ncbi:MAG TPA: hypothetical protein VN043_17975 [Rhodanobacter sp.]|nr:hypothetical protein [Rhodanobacter sp.]
MTIRHSRKTSTLAALATTLLLAACGQSLSGTYVDMTGDVQLTFQSGSEVTLQRHGRSEQDNYAIKGDKVTVSSSGGTVAIFQIEANGCLHSPLYTELCKPKSY